MKKLKDLSFSAKIVLIVLLAILAMVAITLVSVYELKRSTDGRHMSLISNNFSQSRTMLEEKMQGVHAISTLMTVNDQVNSALRDADKEDVQQQLSAFGIVSDFARTIEMSNDGISIYLFVDDDYIIAQDRSTRYRTIRALEDVSWHQELLQEQGHPMWLYVDSLFAQGQRNLMQIRTVMDHNDYTRSLGILAVTLDDLYVQRALDNTMAGQYIAICTSDGTPLVHNHIVLPEGAEYQIHDTVGRFVSLMLAGVPYYACMGELDGSGLYLVSFLPQHLVSEEIDHVRSRVVLAYVMIFCAMGIILIPTLSRMVMRIRQLGRQLAEVPTQGLRKLQPATQQDEIGQLISAYNTMVDEMERMLTTQYELGRAKASAQLKALQSQINPHFLYNTLDMVSWMAKRQETEKIQQVMLALSQFYKLTLSGGRDVITLGEELQLCDAYMKIQQMRWEGAIDYLVEADEELLQARIPKITLQPLIENAIKHGIMQRGEESGSIIVSAAVEKDRRWMTVSVQDNGVGMENSEEMLQKGSGSHYGMKNIEQRLALFFDMDIQIHVDSEQGLGTCVSMRLPVILNREAD